MRPALLSLLLLGGCAAYVDTPPDPALADVKIHVVEMDPKLIAQAKVGLADNGAVKFTTLAYSILDPKGKQCVVVLPKTDDAAFRARLYAHEIRHCRGERHDGRARFIDERPW